MPCLCARFACALACGRATVDPRRKAHLLDDKLRAMAASFDAIGTARTSPENLLSLSCYEDHIHAGPTFTSQVKVPFVDVFMPNMCCG